MAFRFPVSALRTAMLVGVGTLLACAVASAVERGSTLRSVPVALRLVQFGAALLVALGMYALARAPRKARRIVDPMTALAALGVVTLVWQHWIHGAVSASWSLASGAHSGKEAFTDSIPPMDECINGYVVHDVPLVYGCSGRVGSKPDQFYQGYFAALRLAYGMLPSGTDGPPCSRTVLSRSR